MANKAYVVWLGKTKGVYLDWQMCKDSISGYKGAKYKGFKTLEAAEKAWKEGPDNYWGKDVPFESELTQEQLQLIGEPILPSISVDAAWNTATLQMEYRGVDTNTGKEIFHQGPFDEATNNVGEFLAIVHAIALLKKNGSLLPIYSDSENAIKWVKYKAHRSKLVRTEKNKKLFEILERAVKWLKNNDYKNSVLKWETRGWGENPADFDRK